MPQISESVLVSLSGEMIAANIGKYVVSRYLTDMTSGKVHAFESITFFMEY